MASKLITIHVSDETAEKLASLAETFDTSISKFAEALVFAGIQQIDAEGGFPKTLKRTATKRTAEQELSDNKLLDWLDKKNVK